MVPDGTRMKRSSKKFELHVAPHLRTSSATHVLQAHFHPPPRRDSPRLWRRLWALGRRSTNGPGPRHPGASKAVLWRCPEPWVHPGAMSGERGLMACHYQITIRLLSGRTVPNSLRFSNSLFSNSLCFSSVHDIVDF